MQKFLYYHYGLILLLWITFIVILFGSICTFASNLSVWQILIVSILFALLIIFPPIIIGGIAADYSYENIGVTLLKDVTKKDIHSYGSKYLVKTTYGQTRKASLNHDYDEIGNLLVQDETRFFRRYFFIDDASRQEIPIKDIVEIKYIGY